jgi:hypothetical protein
MSTGVDRPAGSGIRDELISVHPQAIRRCAYCQSDPPAQCCATSSAKVAAINRRAVPDRPALIHSRALAGKSLTAAALSSPEEKILAAPVSPAA